LCFKPCKGLEEAEDHFDTHPHKEDLFGWSTTSKGSKKPSSKGNFSKFLGQINRVLSRLCGKINHFLVANWSKYGYL
jgi:hypothetical protein